MIGALDGSGRGRELAEQSAMDGAVRGQLRMKGGADHVGLPDEDWLAAKRREDLDACPDFENSWCADEDHRDLAPIVQRLETLDLAAPGVARDCDVQPAETALLRLRHASGGKDEPGAGGENRAPASNELIQRLIKLEALEEP